MIADPLNADDDMCRQGFDERAFEKCNHGGDDMNAAGGAKRGVPILDFGFRILEAALVCWLWLVASAAADDTATWRAWFEPKSMHAPVAVPLSGGQRTELALGLLGKDGLESFSKAAFDALGQSREQVLAVARENAATDLAGISVRYERDRNKVIQYAELTSQKPIVASAVVSPKLLALFKDTLGDEVLLVVPSRFAAYVFPKLASRYREYYPLIFEAYRATAWPVSVEVFELDESGVHAIGIYEER